MARSLINLKMSALEKFGRFYLHQKLNSGGLADIWLVKDEAGKPFALRLLKPEHRFNFSARRRFAHGCKVLSQLTESMYIIGYVEHGRGYLLMDYVEGDNLKVLSVGHDPVVEEKTAQILIDMATGLSHVHESGFMHLDFKPENILVSRAGAVRVIDFDTAQRISDRPVRLAQNPGTPGYMAPEQLQHEPLDARADIFAYGVSAYELLTNHKPFPGETPEKILAVQMNPAGPVPLSEYNSGVPPRLEKVVLKCLERDPDRRYPVSGMLVRDLQNALYV
jgi:serine/threonine-protein kinase